MDQAIKIMLESNKNSKKKEFRKLNKNYKLQNYHMRIVIANLSIF